MNPIPIATKMSYIVSAAGKYRRNTDISQPNAPSTAPVVRSNRFMICSAIQPTMLSRMPM